MGNWSYLNHMASCSVTNSILKQNIFSRPSLRLLYPRIQQHTRSPFSKMTISTDSFKNPATSTLFDLVKSRRTYYALKSESPVPNSVIETIVKDAVLHVPSSFNTQTTRVVLLLKEEHKKLWNAALSIMEGLVTAGKLPKEMFENNTKPKLEGFRNGYGTVCWFYKLRSFIFVIRSYHFLGLPVE